MFLMNFRILLFIAFSLFLTQLCIAQYTFIKGNVADAETNETLAFVNITFENGRQGVQSNIDGHFSISSKKIINTLTFSYVGYEPIIVDIAPSNDTINVNVLLKRKTTDLGEVVIYPGVNPAHRIIERVLENRDSNNSEKLSSFSYTAYNKMHFTYQEDTAFNRENTLVYLDSILPDSSNIRLKKKLDNHYAMLIESVSQRFFQYPAKNSEKVISSKVSGFSDPSFTMLATQFQSFSFYSNFVTLFEKNYLNPISTGSTNKYLFLLQDTFITDLLDTLYVISFKPRLGTNFDGLKGVLYINTNGYAIQNVIAGPVQSNNRFAIKVQQQYELIDDKHWFPTQLNTDLLFKKLKLKAGTHEYFFTGFGKSYLSDIKINPDLRDVLFSNVDIEMANNANQTADSVWRENRALPLTAKDSATYRMIDSLGRAHDFDKKLNFFDALLSGNITCGIFNLDYKRLIGYNDYEGLKLGLGLATNKKVGSFYSIGGYFSYGFHDKAWKYGSFIQLFPNWQSDTKLSVKYAKDVMEIGGTEFLDDYIMNSSEFFRKMYVKNMNFVCKKEVSFSFRALSHLKFNIFLTNDVKTVRDYNFFPANTDPNVVTNTFSFTEVGISLKLGFREKFMQTPNGRRISLGTKYPMVWFNFHRGLNWLNGNYDYSKYEVKLTKSIITRAIGKSQIQITAGKVVGSIPLCTLYNAAATYQQLSIEAENSFATMRVNEFFSDEFTSIFLRQDFGSLLFSQPKFRPEVCFVTNMGFGRMSNVQYHRQVSFKTLENGYYESGILLNKLLTLNIVGYGLGVFYRYGPYAYQSIGKNFAYKFTVKFNL